MTTISTPVGNVVWNGSTHSEQKKADDFRDRPDPMGSCIEKRREKRGLIKYLDIPSQTDKTRFRRGFDTDLK